MNRLEIEKQAKEAGLVCYLVLDAGKTQIASGSMTVLGIGPGIRISMHFHIHFLPTDSVARIDRVTSKLKLL